MRRDLQRQTPAYRPKLPPSVRKATFIIVVAATALAWSAVALAHSSPYSWTIAKARVMLQESTNIALPEADRVALDAELDAWRKKFGQLLLIAQSEYARTAELGADDPKYSRLAQTYDAYKRRFEAAQATVARGLSIDSVECAGQGKALTGKRYKHFRCNATSYVLEVPNIELVFGDDPFLPEIVEGPRQRIGPLEAAFAVHVTGKSRMLAQRAGERSAHRHGWPRHQAWRSGASPPSFASAAPTNPCGRC